MSEVWSFLFVRLWFHVSFLPLFVHHLSFLWSLRRAVHRYPGISSVYFLIFSDSTANNFHIMWTAIAPVSVDWSWQSPSRLKNHWILQIMSTKYKHFDKKIRNNKQTDRAFAYDVYPEITFAQRRDNALNFKVKNSCQSISKSCKGWQFLQTESYLSSIRNISKGTATL